MKYKLNVNNQTYEVEIENINARPVVVTVDGQRFEVMPENGKQVEVQQEAGAKVESKPSPQVAAPLAASLPPANGNHTLTSPLPGTVIEIFVKPGEQVAAGQVVLVIEAMKMKNSIRSIYGGTVDKVMVSQGQSVAHKQELIHFAE
jgi:biotin carboxyl carrier protein